VWTKEEDDQLRAAVAACPSMDWLLISINVPGKSVFNCRHRWLRYLNPALKKGHWTNEEDQMLVKLIAELGPKYTEIAAHLQGRTGKQCRNRWLMTLSPSVTKDPFTEEEYRTIIKLKKEKGNNWKEICKYLPNRTGGAIGNHFHNYMMRKLSIFLKINDMQNYTDFDEVFHRTELTDDVVDGMVHALKSGMPTSKAVRTSTSSNMISSRPPVGPDFSSDSDDDLIGGHDDGDALDDLGIDSDSEKAVKPKPVKKMRAKNSAVVVESFDALADPSIAAVPTASSGVKRKATVVVSKRDADKRKKKD